ncbi:oligopeptide/dipeptide ABC transporter ATP-binding protein [Saccharopolyspora elongata]|uniref:ABC transporter ATP-binding protein n=1 Tax=Saccharopolyspora elongata TaxID=2530387 RepID=A0A4R4ZCG1_9PSEU|nr:ABC transporter ATP-binding protein [Saccharopolyspora elongata]TDD56098.1 ABC transporter ATP-binding protein [Saccharopolyspora elongata]
MTSPEPETLVELADVHVVHKARSGGLFRRDRVHAVTGVDLAVVAGETVGIVGESGCGKSTLAKVVVGLQRPTSGTISFRGKDIWSLTAAGRRAAIGAEVGMVFQDPATALNRRLPIRQVLRDPLDVHGHGSRQERETRVRELLDLVGLPASVANLLPGQISGGQRQRVAIARALALRPRLLVADEPTSALDVSVRSQILNLLLELKEQLGLAMVFVSHDIQTVRRMSDRVVTMYLGRTVEQIPAGAVAAARHPYTRALFSATPGLLSPIEPIPLTGPVPSATRPPSGCPFRTRCWRADETCAAEMPDPQRDATGHAFRCHHPVPAGTTDLELAAEALSGSGTEDRDPAPGRDAA